MKHSLPVDDQEGEKIMRTKLVLAPLDSDIVRAAEFGMRIPRDSALVRVHVSRGADGAWTWALILRAVGGWEVIASGDSLKGQYADHASVADMIVREYGDGFTEIPREECCVARSKRDACIYAPDGVHSYCGASVKHPAVFDLSKPDHVTQCCVPCKEAYRASHWGRCPVTH